MSKEYKRKYYASHRKQRRKHNKKHFEKRRTLLIKAFGNECFLCNQKKKKLIIHRKDGKKHVNFWAIKMEKLINHIKNHKDEYVKLCYTCHLNVHWLMNIFKMSWEDIIKLGDENK